MSFEASSGLKYIIYQCFEELFLSCIGVWNCLRLVTGLLHSSNQGNRERGSQFYETYLVGTVETTDLTNMQYRTPVLQMKTRPTLN